MSESKPFTFAYAGQIFTAYVRYHEDGDHDVELENDHDCPEAYDLAWELAESKGLLDQHLA